MTTLTDTGFPNLAHIASVMDPKGGIARPANLLSKKNPILDKIPWKEGNLPTGELVTTSGTTLPSGTWRSFNEGVTATNVQTAQYTESCGLLEDWSKIDCALADLGGNAMEYRAVRDDLKMAGLGQQFATAFFYESVTTNPARVHGLSPRWPGTSASYTASSYTLVGTNAGVNCHSFWVFTPEIGKIYGVYPSGTQVGLQKNDLGKQVVTNSSGASFLAYMTQMVWNCGIVVEDYRYAVRGQWDPDDAVMADDERGLVLMLQDAMDTIFEKTPNTVIFMNRTTRKKLRRQLASNDSNLLSQVVLEGRGPVLTFDGIPIYIEDALVAETAIS